MFVFRCLLLLLIVCLQGNYCKPAHDEPSEDRGYISTLWNSNWTYFLPWGSAADAKETSFNFNESKNSSLLKNQADAKARMLTAVTRNIDLTTEKRALESGRATMPFDSFTIRSVHDYKADAPQDSQKSQLEPLTAEISAAEPLSEAKAVSTSTTPIFAFASAKNNIEKMGKPLTKFLSEPKASITLIPPNIDNLPAQDPFKTIEEPTEEQTLNSEMSTTPIALNNDYWTTIDHELDSVAGTTLLTTTLDIVTAQTNPVVELAIESEVSKDAGTNDIVLMMSTTTDDESTSTELTSNKSTEADEIMNLKNDLAFIAEKAAMYSDVDDVLTTTELDTGLTADGDLMLISTQPSLNTLTEEDATPTSTHTALNLFTNVNIDGDLILTEPTLRPLKGFNEAAVQTPLFPHNVEINNSILAAIDEDITSTESAIDPNIVGEDAVTPINEQMKSIPIAVDPTTEAFIELVEFSTVLNAAPKQKVITDEEKILVLTQSTGLEEAPSIKASAATEEPVFTEVHETVLSVKNLVAFTEGGDTLITKEPDANSSTRIKEGLILTKHEPNAVAIDVNGTKTTKLDEVPLPTKSTTYYFSKGDGLVLTKLDLSLGVEEKSDEADKVRNEISTSDTSTEVVKELTSGVTDAFVASLDSVTGGTTHSAGFQLSFDYSCLYLLFTIHFLKPLSV